MLRAHEFGNASLVRRIRVAVQQDDRHGVDALGGDFTRGGAHRCLVERLDDSARSVDAAGNFPDMLRRNRTRRLHPREEIRLARDIVPADFKNVLEAAGDQYRGRRSLALEYEIGRHRRAVQDAADARAVYATRRESVGYALPEAARMIVGSRCRLRDPQAPVGRIQAARRR